jgi:translation initiation factor IF-3
LPIPQNLRVNEQIKISPVRLIDESGAQVGVVDTEDARERAVAAGLDLVEVAPNARPPVCRILDYGKFKYKQKKRSQQAKHRQHHTVIKEIRLKPKIDEHDLDFKMKNARRFLEHNDKVLLNMRFRGREMLHLDLGRALLNHCVEVLGDVAKVEQPSKLEGRRMAVLLAPKHAGSGTS